MRRLNVYNVRLQPINGEEKTQTNTKSSSRRVRGVMSCRCNKCCLAWVEGIYTSHRPLLRLRAGRLPLTHTYAEQRTPNFSESYHSLHATRRSAKRDAVTVKTTGYRRSRLNMLSPSLGYLHSAPAAAPSGQTETQILLDRHCGLTRPLPHFIRSARASDRQVR